MRHRKTLMVAVLVAATLTACGSDAPLSCVSEPRMGRVEIPREFKTCAERGYETSSCPADFHLPQYEDTVVGYTTVCYDSNGTLVSRGGKPVAGTGGSNH